MPGQTCGPFEKPATCSVRLGTMIDRVLFGVVWADFGARADLGPMIECLFGAMFWQSAERI